MRKRLALPATHHPRSVVYRPRSKGLILQGILVEVLAKLLGTLLVARMFALTKPQLLTFIFLRIIYTTITRWLQWAREKVTETSVYRWAKQLKVDKMNQPKRGNKRKMPDI